MSAEQWVEALRARLSRPEGELRVQTGRDGSHRVALDGHLQHATIAVMGADGRVHTSCVDGPEAAAHALSVPPRGTR